MKWLWPLIFAACAAADLFAPFVCLPCRAETSNRTLLISDHFTGEVGASLSNRATDTGNGDPVAWVTAAFNTGGSFVARIAAPDTAGASSSCLQLICGGNSNGAVVIPITISTDPQRLSLSAKLRGSSPSLGFYTSPPSADPDGVRDVFFHFTGLQIVTSPGGKPDSGSLVLYRNGAIIDTIAYTGSFDPGQFHALSFDFDTRTGEISNVRFEGSTRDYSAFSKSCRGNTGTMPAYAAVGCLAYNSRDNVVFADDFQLFAEPLPALPAAATVESTPAPGASPILVRTGDKIGFMGDSITEQAGGPRGYITLTLAGLKLAGVDAAAIPAGISGQTSANMVGRVHHDILHRGANFMTLSCGVNDVMHQSRGFGVDLAHYQQNVDRMVKAAQGWGVKVVILTATPLGEDLANAGNAQLGQYNDFLCSYAKEHNCVLADVNAAFAQVLKSPLQPGEVEGKRLLADGIHPNVAGQFLMAKVLLEALGVPPADMHRIQTTLRQVPPG